MDTCPKKSQSHTPKAVTAKPAGRHKPTTHRSADDMDIILAISRALAGKLELKNVLGTAMAQVHKFVGAEGASVLLIEPQTNKMNFYIAEGPQSETVKNIPVPPKAGICGYVAQNGLPIIVNDAQNDPRLYRAVDNSTGITTKNILCVPIRSAERLWGVLELINKHGDKGFGQEDMRLAEILAAQIGIALENSHLHKQIVAGERMAAIGQTVSGLAHCIKNILNGIRSGSTVVDNAMDKDDFNRVRQGWKTVRRNNGMLGNLVLDMLALARQSKPNPLATDINDLAEQVCKLLEDQAAERGVSVDYVAAAKLPEIIVDPTHFYRCLLNLVSNAVDACEENGNVKVRTYRGKERSRFTVSVTDNGNGISKENQAKLFQEFFSTKGGRGTGLGLTVTKKLICELGGKITFHSTPGQGTKFVFMLPIQKQQPKKQETN